MLVGGILSGGGSLVESAAGFRDDFGGNEVRVHGVLGGGVRNVFA